MLAIYPLKAGGIDQISLRTKLRLYEIFDDENIINIALRFPLLYPAVITEVINTSISNESHLASILAAVFSVDSDQAMFMQVYNFLMAG